MPGRRFTSNPYHKQQQMRDLAQMMEGFAQDKEKDREKLDQRWIMEMNLIQKAAESGRPYEALKGYLDKWEANPEFSDRTAIWRGIVQATGSQDRERAEMVQQFVLPALRQATEAMPRVPGEPMPPGVAGPPEPRAPADNPMARYQAAQLGVDLGEYLPEQPARFDPSKLQNDTYAQFFRGQLPQNAQEAANIRSELNPSPEAGRRMEQEDTALALEGRRVSVSEAETRRRLETGGKSLAGGGGSVAKPKHWRQSREKEIRQNVLDNRATEDSEERTKVPSIKDRLAQADEEAQEVFVQAFVDVIRPDRIKFLKDQFDKLIRKGASPDEAAIALKRRYPQLLEAS